MTGRGAAAWYRCGVVSLWRAVRRSKKRKHRKEGGKSMVYALMKKAMKVKHADETVEIMAFCALILVLVFVAACVVAYIL